MKSDDAITPLVPHIAKKKIPDTIQSNELGPAQCGRSDALVL